MFKKNQNQEGFTLVELLVVIAIIGILAVVAVPALFSNINKAKVADVEADYNAIKSASLAYYTDKNEMPSKLTDANEDLDLDDYMDSVPKISAFGGEYSINNHENNGKKRLALSIKNPKMTKKQCEKLINDLGEDKVYKQTGDNGKWDILEKDDVIQTGQSIHLILIDNIDM